MRDPAGAAIRLGLGPNLAQFSLLVLVNAFVGAMAGLERTVVPLLAERDFHLAARSAALSFIAVFGVVKALANYFAGRLSDSFGRKPVLVGGWLLALPVPLLLMWAPSWGWILVANALLGASQGLAWSTTVVMKIDLAGPERRGLAMGLNEFAGYVAVALSALATGYLAAVYGLRPMPFVLGIGLAALGLLLAAGFVRETREHARHEAKLEPTGSPDPSPSQREIFLDTSFRDPNLSSLCQAGLVNNLNDGAAWGLFPLLYSASGLPLERIGWLAALYPAVWGLGQLFTGAISDRSGRKWLVAGGMGVQALGIGATAASESLAGFVAGAAFLGLGTAMAYPALLAAVGDASHPSWRASAVGVYRLWRDLGYALGAVLSGAIADLFGLRPAIGAVASLTAASGAVVAIRLEETRPHRRPGRPAASPPESPDSPPGRPARGPERGSPAR